ncbi:hypothetical protein [Burkholderia gladioli]|uniref:hypothetical protein n=1 Tax=Burkholderia gladioli TaxID=28095 RepID=UPI00163E8010|nr:hypothetical protein [Burkholderia gladioli]
MLFRRRAGSRPGYATSDVINAVMWSEVRDESWIETGFLAIPLEDPKKTISQFLADIDGGITDPLIPLPEFAQPPLSEHQQAPCSLR